MDEMDDVYDSHMDVKKISGDYFLHLMTVADTTMMAKLVACQFLKEKWIRKGPRCDDIPKFVQGIFVGLQMTSPSDELAYLMRLMLGALSATISSMDSSQCRELLRTIVPISDNVDGPCAYGVQGLVYDLYTSFPKEVEEELWGSKMYDSIITNIDDFSDCIDHDFGLLDDLPGIILTFEGDFRRTALNYVLHNCDNELQRVYWTWLYGTVGFDSDDSDNSDDDSDDDDDDDN
ncbi:hypothetical protein DIURU_003849 [Diutina rugosa]|uniref:Uncharacterized protein n=1 Tax=Diutina rugosa TaxID=5481 RepID=A0A642UJZ1_DIURU|nr:uncharacterized protein DIURU_003849 [Diutina rugosa]KAA8900426.1 hypothetical protein DIURU_003849 [Diutina rugosa]